MTNTTETQATVTGQRGSTYRFISIATDTAGNVEAKQPASEATILVALPGDVNGDGAVTCADITLVETALGTKVGQKRYNPAADIKNDGAVNLLDLLYIIRQLPSGTKCKIDD